MGPSGDTIYPNTLTKYDVPLNELVHPGSVLDHPIEGVPPEELPLGIRERVIVYGEVGSPG